MQRMNLAIRSFLAFIADIPRQAEDETEGAFMFRAILTQAKGAFCGLVLSFVIFLASLKLSAGLASPPYYGAFAGFLFGIILND